MESLKDEFPKLKTFATLSPIPGFKAWLGKHAPAMLEALDAKERKLLGHALAMETPTALAVLAAADDGGAQLPEKSALRQWLLRCAAHYLGQALTDDKPPDPVARFHLGNGARVERLNWAGDPSPKGHKQSYGMMVNYLYDLKRLDKHRAQLAQGRIPVSGAVQSLFIGH